MSQRPFLDKPNKPGLSSLEGTLGAVWPLYQRLVELTSTFKQSWNHSKSGGWMLKVARAPDRESDCIPNANRRLEPTSPNHGTKITKGSSNFSHFRSDNRPWKSPRIALTSQ